MNAHLILALAGFAGTIIVACLIMMLASGRRRPGTNGGTDISQWSEGHPSSHGGYDPGQDGHS